MTRCYGVLALAALSFGLIACDGNGAATRLAASDTLSETGGQWELVWSDDFEGDAIDTGKWSHEINCWGGGNNELQCYTDAADNSYVKDGKLHIVARQQRHSGSPVNSDAPGYDPADKSVTRDYTSARLSTRGLAQWRYGRIEVRAKMPEGQGIWPAIWMMPAESVYGSWPLSGEIDIFEGINLNASDGNEVHGYLHYGALPPGNVNSGTSHVPEKNVWEHFHTYALEWEEGVIRWYVDDTHYATQTSDGWYNYYPAGEDGELQIGAGAAPFDQAFYLILNVAVGGDWPGPPNADTRFPQQMLVDWVRVYRCGADPETGRGCATVDPTIVPLTGFSGPEIPASGPE